MHNERISRLLARLETEGLDALLVSALPNIFYLSGFTGSSAQLLLTDTRRWFITDFRYHERLGTEVRGGWQLADITGMQLAELLPALKGATKLRRIGFEAAHVSVQLRAQLATVPVEWVSTLGWVEDLRAVKDSSEAGRLERAERLGETVFGELLPYLRAGVKESEIAAEIEYRARRHGAKATSFAPIIASGTRSAVPHAGFTDSPLRPGVPTIIDMGVLLEGYCSDMTRTVFLGDCPPLWRERYALVRAAKDAGFSALRPGQSCHAADHAARAVIAAAGLGSAFGHGLGHGVGVQIHEEPRLIWDNERLLEPGNVVTCEPGVYFPGEGGIRLEDLLLITESGAKNLNQLSTDLLVL